jgi:hypothetical protein
MGLVKLKPRQIKHLARIIQSEVGYFNGWAVSQERETEDCLEAAKRIAEYLKKTNGRKQ